MTESGGMPAPEQAVMDQIKVGETVDMTPAEKRTESAARKRQENEQKNAESAAVWRGRWDKLVKVKDAVAGAVSNIPETAGRVQQYVRDIPAKVDTSIAKLDNYIDKKTDAWADSLDGTVQWTEDKLGGNGEHFADTMKKAQEALKNAKRNVKNSVGRIGEDQLNVGEFTSSSKDMLLAQAAVKALEATRKTLHNEGLKAKDRAPLTRGLANKLRSLRGV